VTEPTEEPAPKRKAKKRRRKKRTGAAQPKASPQRPPFARAFPDDPVIGRLLQAFELGNYAYVRTEARLLEKSDDPAMRKVGQELLRRLKPDAVSAYLIGLAAVLLSFFSIWYWTHPHP